MEIVEIALRNSAHLTLDKPLHLAPVTFRCLAGAIACRQRLTQDHHYSPDQIGVFAEDIGCSGAKQFLVDTYPGFARAVSPGASRSPHEGPSRIESRSFYEVILLILKSIEK